MRRKKKIIDKKFHKFSYLETVMTTRALWKS